jgi:hypothetical protein
MPGSSNAVARLRECSGCRRIGPRDRRFGALVLPPTTPGAQNPLVPTNRNASDLERLDRIVADARRVREVREQGYRSRALKLFPWICGRCAREFDHSTVHVLTVHHKDHNHDNNPPDGGNWELLCLYCHDNEHQRFLGQPGALGGNSGSTPPATHSPFADLASLLKSKD